MTKFILIAGTALAMSAGMFVSANALPSVGKTTGAEGASNVQQATFYRWRGWDRDRRWHHRHHYYRRGW